MMPGKKDHEPICSEELDSGCLQDAAAMLQVRKGLQLCSPGISSGMFPQWVSFRGAPEPSLAAATT